MTNPLLKQRELADPHNWTRLDKSQEAMAGLIGGADESQSRLNIWSEYDWAMPPGAGQSHPCRAPAGRFLVRGTVRHRDRFSEPCWTPSGKSNPFENERGFLMEDLASLAEEMAEQKPLLTSMNQKLSVLLEGCHHQLPPTAILLSACANQERNCPHI